MVRPTNRDRERKEEEMRATVEEEEGWMKGKK